MDLNQLTLDCADLERSTAFYKSLGFRLIVWAPPRYARFEAPTGSTTLSLHHSDPCACAGTSAYFEVEDVDATVARLKAAGVAFETEPTDQSWRWREAWFADPDGRRLCIYHAGPDRRFPPWRTDADGNRLDEN